MGTGLCDCQPGAGRGTWGGAGDLCQGILSPHRDRKKHCQTKVETKGKAKIETASLVKIPFTTIICKSAQFAII